MKLKILLSAFALLCAFIVSVVYFSSVFNSDMAGDITVEIIDENGQTVSEEVVEFEEGDTLYDVLNRHFELRVSGSKHDTLGRILLGIDELNTDFQTQFIYIEVDGEEARKGIDYLPLQDGSRYRFSIRQPH